MDESAASGEQALVIGAGGIGSAVLAHWSRQARFDTLWQVGRRQAAAAAGARLLVTDHSDASIAECVATLAEQAPRLTRIVITLGTLHGTEYAPEKSLRDLQGDAMAEVHRVNCVLPLLWVARLAPLLRRADDCRIAVLSARVGSIGDNRLGGWYSYRCSKAALNMGLKSAAVELGRSARGVKLIAYHPGTVDTGLSAPFQARVPAAQLFSPQRAAGHLVDVMESQTPDGQLAYLDWAGESIPW